MANYISAPFALGVTLERIAASGASFDTACGSVGYWSAILDHLATDSLGYYTPKDANGWPIAASKFYRHVFWHVVAQGQDMDGLPGQPYAGCDAWCCPANAQGEIHIYVRYFDPNLEPQRMTGCISHEMGHALHFWCRLWSGLPELAGLEQFWERQFAINGTTYNPSAAPWRRSNGALETPMEQFANAAREKFGVLAERGSSGVGSDDPVIDGFADPVAHPEWKKAMQLLGETSAFARSYGAVNVLWHADASGSLVNGQWWFQTTKACGPAPAGSWIAQTSYNTWFYYTASGWVQFLPNYSVS